MSELLTSLEPLQPALTQQPFALLCDVDGTISPLAAAPHLARVTPRCRQLLDRLSATALVALVSGRDVPDVQRMVGLPNLIYIGLHGLAWRVAGADDLAREAEPYQAYTRDAADELGHLVRMDGVVLETKRVGLALHYRSARSARSARAQIMRAIASSPAAGHFAVQEGIRLVELRPPVGVTKGVAVQRFGDRFGLRGLIYAGDDITDIDAFEEVHRLRLLDTITGFGLAVAHAEAPEAAAAAADFTLPGVEGVEWLLGAIAEFLEGRGARTEG